MLPTLEDFDNAIVERGKEKRMRLPADFETHASKIYGKKDTKRDTNTE